MRKIFFLIGMLAILISCLAGTAAASTISFDPATVTISPGSTAQVKVVLSDAPQGLAGYKLTVKYPSSIVTVTGASFPSWASSLNLKNSVSGGYLISAVDINKQVQAGSNNIELGTITVSGTAAGSATFSIADIQMNDDNDAVMSPSAGTLQVTVEGSAVTTTVTPTPAETAITTIPTATTTATTTVTATATTIPVTTGATIVTTTEAVTQSTTVPAATITVPSPVIVAPAMPGFPASGFTASKVIGYEPLDVQFRDLSTGESLTGWEWDFGDGGSSMAQNPGYTYRSPGIYTVMLTVTNNLGSTTSTRTGFIRVLGPGEPMPTVVQTAQQTVTTVPTELVHTLPVWTSPQKPAATSTGKSGMSPAITGAAIGIAALGCLALWKKRNP